LHFKSTAVINNVGGSYDADFVFIPSPILFGTASVYEAGGAPVRVVEMVNNQIPGGPTVAPLSAQWRQNVSSARLAYYGVTLYYDAPSLYDQGGLLVAQLPPSFTVDYNTVGAPSAIYSGGPLRFDQLMGLPLAVQHQAKLGAYAPIKLNQPALPFKDQQQLMNYQGWYPTIGGLLVRYPIPPLLDAQMCCISFRNVAQQASIRVVIRMGVEFTPVSFSSYSPFTKSSPPPDSIALDTYFRVSGTMADGWPAEYNDLGKLVGVLKSVGKVIWPTIRSAIGAVPGGSAVLGTGEQVVKAIRAASQAANSGRKKKKNGAAARQSKR
jgi:hypothetical protein